MTCPSCGQAVEAPRVVCESCDVGALEPPRTDAPAPIADAPAWISLSSLELASAIDDTDRWICEAEAKLAPARERKAYMLDVLARRMADEGAMELTHPYLIVRREPIEHKPVPMVSVLREGFAQLVKDGVLTEADVKPGLWLEQPEPIWRVNLTKLKPLARRFGKAVQDLLTRAVLRAAPTFRLTIAPNPKVVDPARTLPSTSSTPSHDHDSPAPTTTTSPARSSS